LKPSFALGQVEGSSITLKGHMVDAQWHLRSELEYENFIVLGDKEIESVWYPDKSEGLYDELSEPVHFACFAIDSGVTTSGSRFVAGLTLAKIEAEGGEYRRLGVFRLGGPEGVEYFLGKEIQQIAIV
jgi:hypothetical protein